MRYISPEMAWGLNFIFYYNEELVTCLELHVEKDGERLWPISEHFSSLINHTHLSLGRMWEHHTDAPQASTVTLGNYLCLDLWWFACGKQVVKIAFPHLNTCWLFLNSLISPFKQVFSSPNNPLDVANLFFFSARGKFMSIFRILKCSHTKVFVFNIYIF